MGVVLSLLMLISRTSKPAIRRLEFDSASRSYLDPDRHPGLQPSDRELVIRMDGPLFFADANRFRDSSKDILGGLDSPVSAVILDADAISQTDTDGADILIQVAGELRSKGISLYLARTERSIRELWNRAGVEDAIGPECYFPTVRGAVDAAAKSAVAP